MTPQTISIITQDDSEHKFFIEELQKKFLSIIINPQFVLNANAGKLSNSNIILSNINNSIAVLKLDCLPYPLPNEIKVLAVLKSNVSSANNFALLTKNLENILPETISKTDIQDSFGKVFLVGGGQSKKDLLSVKATFLISNADIILYDSLIDKSIIESSKAEKVFVGKRANVHLQKQDDINQLLFKAALKYKTVVRLKGGDPMIFGHAGEEIAFLEARLIQVETIPGICSPLGAASMYNIPLTLRNISNSVSFCSAHEKTNILVPETDTIVYFMCATNLITIAKTLKANNKPITTPVTLFYNIGAKDQEIFYETIESILENNIVYKSPLLAIVGEVGNKNNWYKAFNSKPKTLFTGLHIANYAHLGYVFHQPMIEIAGLDNVEEIDYEIENLDSYEYLVFTSKYAVKFFFERIMALGYDSRFLSDLKIVSIGQFTSKYLNNYGIIPDMQAIDESSEGIIKLFKENNIDDSSILIPRSNLANDQLPDSLAEMGNVVIQLIVYNTNRPNISNKLEIENFDKVIFTSPSGVDNFMKIYRKLPLKPEIITKGKETKKRVDFYGKRQNIKQ